MRKVLPWRWRGFPAFHRSPARVNAFSRRNRVGKPRPGRWHGGCFR